MFVFNRNVTGHSSCQRLRKAMQNNKKNAEPANILNSLRLIYCDILLNVLFI